MTTLPSELTNMVFRRVDGRDFGELSIDSRMLNILISLDGKLTVGQIASKNGLNMGDIRNALARLMDYHLIEPVEQAVKALDASFLKYLGMQLSQNVGPISGILIEDAARVLGHRPSQIPTHRAAELVDLLSKEIQQDERRNQFKKNMVDRIKTL